MPDSCTTCGASLDPRAIFCDECGAFTDDAPPHPAETFEAQPGAPSTARRSAPTPASTAGEVTVQPPLLDVPPTPPRSAPARTATLAQARTDTPDLPADLAPYRQRLQDVFGYPDFRGGQARALEALAASDVLAVMPTGSGKSLCYVLPALEVGRTVVVSPLIALMQDQVEGLQAAGVAATFINSNLDRREQNDRYRSFVNGAVDLLFVAPERFQNAAFTYGLRKAGVHLLAIDEAHCISEWGHNFRPDYLQLGVIRERLGAPRTLALTATADPMVRRDIVARLGIGPAATEVVTSVDRPNLTYTVEALDSLQERRRWVVDYVRARRGLTGIIYVRTRRGVEDLATTLQQAGLKAEPYHAGFDRTDRTRVQRAFTRGDLPVIVATNAFGMGIDKPDVRYVIHMNMPGRLEAYYQEAGRAGRDGDPSECTLLYARIDRNAQQRFIDDAHPNAADVREAWKHWLAAADPHTRRVPSEVANDAPDSFAMTVAALRDSGLIDPVDFRVTSSDPAARIDMSSIEKHRTHAEARLRDMVEYAESDTCRRAVILRYFGEEASDACSACDNCLQRHKRSTRASATEDAGDFDDTNYAPDLYDAIVDLREQIARRSSRDPFLVFENRTARELATYRPTTEEALQQIWGIGERRAAWFGADLLEIIEEWERDHPDAPSPPALERTHRAPAPPSDPSLAEALERVRPDDPLYVALRTWRMERARAEGSPAFTIFSDRTLRELVAAQPQTLEALHRIWGLGDARIQRFGDELIEVIRAHEGGS